MLAFLAYSHVKHPPLLFAVLYNLVPKKYRSWKVQEPKKIIPGKFRDQIDQTTQSLVETSQTLAGASQTLVGASQTVVGPTRAQAR